MPILFLIVFIDLIGFGVVIPLLPYYALRYDASPFAVTSLMACYSLAQFVTAPMLGRWSDRVGRRPVLLVSLACTCAAYVWLALAGQFWKPALRDISLSYAVVEKRLLGASARDLSLRLIEERHPLFNMPVHLGPVETAA